MFRQNCGCNPLARRPSDAINDGRCSLTESRFSIASTKYVHHRSTDESRNQKTSRNYTNRQSNYRMPISTQTRTNKVTLPHRNSQPSLLYSCQLRH